MNDVGVTVHTTKDLDGLEKSLCFFHLWFVSHQIEYDLKRTIIFLDHTIEDRKQSICQRIPR